VGRAEFPPNGEDLAISRLALAKSDADIAHVRRRNAATGESGGQISEMGDLPADWQGIRRLHP
jgi:hypothetical protein